MKRLIYILFLMLVTTIAGAQQQFIVLQNGKVLIRYAEGSILKCILRNGRHTDGKIVELLPFTIITTNDTIPIQSIRKIDLRKHRGRSLNSVIGGGLIVGGLGYVAIDEINGALGIGNNDFNSADTRGLVAAGLGALLIVIKPRYLATYRVALRIIDYNSPYYLKVE